MAPSASRSRRKSHVEQDNWVEGCFNQLSRNNPKCEQFLAEVNERLSYKLGGELDNEVKQQALFHLLGRQYVQLHFPHHRYNTKLLNGTKEEVRAAYINEMKLLLDEQISISQRDLGYPRDVRYLFNNYYT